jgi:hypothetical protein
MNYTDNTGTLELKDGYLFVAWNVTMWSEPVCYRHWWPTEIPFSSYATWAGGYEEAHARIGQPVKAINMSQGVFEDCQHLRFRLADGPGTKPVQTNKLDIPEPVQRGRKCEISFRDGAWHKYTRQYGWVRA